MGVDVIAASTWHGSRANSRASTWRPKRSAPGSHGDLYGDAHAPTPAKMSTAKGANNPANFLKTVLGRPVVVKLNSGVDYRGARPARSSPCARAGG